MSQTYTDNCFTTTGVVQTQMGQVEENFAALKSAFSGATTPANTVAGMWWFDTTANILKLRNEANSAWLSVWDFANNKPIVTNNISADFGAALKDPAAGTAGLRTLGTTAVKACAGNDARLSDTRIPMDSTVTYTKMGNILAGDVYLGGSLAEVSTTSGAYAKVKTLYVGHKGTYRIKFEIKRSTTGTAYGRIYRNGSAVGTVQTSTSYVYVTKSEDISGWAAGDACEIYLHHNGNYLVFAKNLKIYCDGARVVWE